MKQHPYWTPKRVREHLRSCNQHFDGPGVALVVDRRGVLTDDIEGSAQPWQYVSEVPGDGLKFDVAAEARQILAAWRDAQTGELEAGRYRESGAS